MTANAEPWAAFGEPELRGIAPGWIAQARRAEALEAAREKREADERRAQAEDRRDLWMRDRMRELAWRGVPFDPNDLSTLVRSPEQLAAEVFAVQDAEAARAERRALVEAGLLTLLPARFAGDEAAAPPPSDVSPVLTSAGAGSAGAAPTATAARSGPGARIRAALTRWAGVDRNPHPLSTNGREVTRHNGPDTLDDEYQGVRYR
jgi:hypothetical protein